MLSKKISIGLLSLALIPFTSLINAQCANGEVEITMTVHTDDYGYEGYWEIVPTGNGCGNGTIASGGNTGVGCNGSNSQGGYGNNLEINEGPWCLTEGTSYDLIYIDSYGDAGFSFDLMANGYVIDNFETMAGSSFAFTFIAQEPEEFDLQLYSIASPYINDDEGDKTLKGVIFNRGTATISSFDLNYQVDNGTVYSQNIPGLYIPNYQTYHYEHEETWTATAGLHAVKVWVSNVNGVDDQNNDNDTIVKNVEIGTEIPNILDQFLPNAFSIEQIGSSSDQLDKPTDLDFHPVYSRKELWVMNKRTEGVGGSTTLFNNAGESNQTDQTIIDGNAWHFMSLPTGIAFSKNGNFANSPGVYDANHQQSGLPFTGPSLWSSNLAIYGQPSGGNGSHLDMLHASPYSQGIASEEDNIFWLFDGYSNDIVRYDFKEDHGPGNSFHGDAVVRRYNDFSVSKDPNNKVPSHLDIEDGWVYVVDYGNKRVLRIEMNTGSTGGTPTFGPFESIVEYKYVTGYNYEEIVTTGLEEPCGIDVIDDRMIISDYATGEIIFYDLATSPATELGRIATGAQGIMGINIGPEGNIWYVDYDANKVHKMSVDFASGISNKLDNTVLTISPNPAKNAIMVNTSNIEGSLKVFDVTGKLVFSENQEFKQLKIDCSQWNQGIYTVVFHSTQGVIAKKVTIL